MKRSLTLLFVLFLALPVLGASLGTAARTVIPSDVIQIISVDYRALRNSSTAMQLKDRVLPANLKQFESALQSAGVEEKDIEQITFALFRAKEGEKVVGVASGNFPAKEMLARFKKQKVVGEKYKGAVIYPMSGTQMSFLDDWTMVFGDSTAIKAALSARAGDAPSLNSNGSLIDMMGNVQSGAVWSVLDQGGTQNMLRASLGDVSKLADYDVVKKRLVGSRYQMNFSQGVNFDLDVITNDNMTAATLNSLLTAGKQLKLAGAKGAEKVAIESMTVDSDSNQLRLHFKTDDQKFEALMHSDLFNSISR